MANYYCDHGAYPTYAAVPSWGVAQEGDGKATGLSTSAIASMLINGVSVAGDTLGIAGVTLIAVASGATAAQFNVGATTTAQADNIATAINAATATVGASVATGTPQLRNLMYARGPSSGAPANTVQIMTRCGSADFNYATNSNMALVSAGWGSAPTMTQFASGASGVWGYLVNTTALWPSGLTAGTYGAWITGAGLQPLHGPSSLSLDADFINVRTRGQEITLPNNVGIANFGRSEATYLYDDGSGDVAEWSGDTGALTIKLVNKAGGNLRRQPSATPVRVREISKTLGRVLFVADGVSGSVIQWYGYNQILYVGIGLDFTDTPTSGATAIYKNVDTAVSYAHYRFQGCRHTFTRNVFFSPDPTLTSADHLRYEVNDTDYVWTALSTAPSVAMMVCNDSNLSFVAYENCRFSGLPAPVKLFSGTFSGSTGSGMVMRGDSCTGCDNPGTIVGITGVGLSVPEVSRYMLLQNLGAKKAYRLETSQGYTDWFPDQGYPTLASQLPDGTYWSYRAAWSNTLFVSNSSASVTPLSPFTLMRSTKSVLSEGMATVTVNLMVDGTYASAITNSHIGMDVSYISDADGKRKSTSSYNPASSTALVSSLATWDTGSYGSHVPRKLTCTLPDDIRAGTEIEVFIRAYRPAPTATQYVFVDPEVELS